MTRMFKTILVFAGLFSLVFLILSCDSEQPEPTINRVVKRQIKTEDIPFDPTIKWKSPLTLQIKNDPALFPEPYPDLNRIIEDAPAWDGGFSIWSPVSETPKVGSAKGTVQPDDQAPPKPEPRRGPYVLLLGTFAVKMYADKGVSEFQALGLPVFLERFTYKKRRYYGIFYGGYPNRQKARQAGNALMKQGKVDEFYVRKLPGKP